MRFVLSAILGVALVGCSSLQPVAVRAGDVCYRCNRVISEPRLAAQIIRTDGQVSTFKTPGCLAKYLQDNSSGVRAIFVTDYETGEMFPVASAKFVRATIDRETKERDFFAYKSVSQAAKRAADEYSGVVDWSMVRTMAGAEKKTD